MYEAERRERRTSLLGTEAVVAAALQERSMLKESYFALVDAIFPENVKSREKLVTDKSDLLERETKRVRRVRVPKKGGKTSRWQRMKDIRVTKRS